MITILNLTCILQLNKLLQTLNEINASLQKLSSGNEKCNANNVDDNTDGQHDPYVFAMLHRQHKNANNNLHFHTWK